MSKNITISPIKSFIKYLSIDLLGFCVNSFGYSTIANKVKVFYNLTFPNYLKVLESYIGITEFLYYLILYYAKLFDFL